MTSTHRLFLVAVSLEAFLPAGVVAQGPTGRTPRALPCARTAGGCAATGLTGGARVSAIRNSDGLLLSDPQPLFTGTALGMNAMPDQQTPILHRSDGAYQLFVTGVLPGRPGGVVSVFTSPDLTRAAEYQTGGPVLKPPRQKVRGGGATCADPSGGDGCADYIGMESVFETTAPGHLVGFYIADQTEFAAGNCPKGAFYGQLGVATSQDDGRTWTRHGPTLRGGTIPSTCTKPQGPIALNQPTLLKAAGSYYVYFALGGSPAHGLAVARASVRPDGMPGPWDVFQGGRWVPMPLDSGHVADVSTAEMVVPMAAYTTMPWISYNTYLQTYLLTFVTQDGFYYSKLENHDLDAQRWTTPQVFAQVPGGRNWARCDTTWENLSFVTPGAADNHVTGKDGYVVLSVVPGWSCGRRGERSFSLASYGFGLTAPPPPPVVPPVPTPRPSPCPRGGRNCLQHGVPPSSGPGTGGSAVHRPALPGGLP